MNTNYRLIHMWSKCRRVGYSLEPQKTPFCIHFAHTHTHTYTQRTPECIAKTTTCKKQTKKQKQMQIDLKIIKQKQIIS